MKPLLQIGFIAKDLFHTVSNLSLLFLSIPKHERINFLQLWSIINPEIFSSNNEAIAILT